MNLSPEQRAAADSRARYVRIIAGPGSGKTTTLAARAVSLLLDQGVSPRTLVCVSFTRKASLELRDRVESALAETLGAHRAAPLAAHVTFGTMHSWCLSLLRQYGPAINLPESLTVLDEFDVTDIKKSLAAETRLDGEALEMAYAQHKLAIGACDYDDLLVKVRDLLDGFGGEAMQRRLMDMGSRMAIIYDEFQDIGPVEWEILRRLGPHRLTVVGDPDQNIYSWRGTDLRFLIDFPGHFPGAESFTLGTNWRSLPAVVAAANALIANNRVRLDKPNESWSLAASGEVSLAGWPPPPCLAPDELAVLARTNREVEQAARDLASLGYVVEVISTERGFWGAEPVRVMLWALRWLENPRHDYALERLLDAGIWTGPPRVELAQAKYDALGLRTPLGDVLAGALKLPEPLVLARAAWESAQIALMPLAMRVSAVAGILGIQGHYQKQLRPEKAQMIGELVRRISAWSEAENVPSARDFLAWQAMRSAQDSRRRPGAIAVSTVHGAKGLEWDRVIVLGADAGRFPLERAGSDMEEERRLMYVALTRARKSVLLVHDPQRAPSTFLAEMGLAEVRQ